MQTTKSHEPITQLPSEVQWTSAAHSDYTGILPVSEAFEEVVEVRPPQRRQRHSDTTSPISNETQPGQQAGKNPASSAEHMNYVAVDYQPYLENTNFATSQTTWPLPYKYDAQMAPAFIPLPSSRGPFDDPEASNAIRNTQFKSTYKKGSIPKVRWARPRQPKVFCHRCADHPDGFRGEHELRRHIDAKHPEHGLIKKWICTDPTLRNLSVSVAVVNPLDKCKACKQRKQYSAYYNAAAHLRRSHFGEKPSHAKRNNRNSFSHDEKRGGKGGGDWPPMADLKNWMQEVWVKRDSEALYDENPNYETNMDLPDGVDFVIDGLDEYPNYETNMDLPEDMDFIIDGLDEYPNYETNMDLPEDMDFITDGLDEYPNYETNIDLPEGVDLITDGLDEYLNYEINMDLPDGMDSITNGIEEYVPTASADYGKFGAADLGSAHILPLKGTEGSNSPRRLYYEPTDSGYASLPNIHRLTNNQNEANDIIEESMAQKSLVGQIPESEAGTVLSAATSIIPEVAQDSIVCICEDIYNNIKLEVDTANHGSVVDTLPEIIKSFALRLGADASDEMNRNIMYFVYINHKKISARLREILVNEDNCMSELESGDKIGMSLSEKISLWVRDEFQRGPQQEPGSWDHFEGVDDLENDELSTEQDLPIYGKVIMESAAYKWLLSTMKTKLTLHFGDGHSGNVADSIRQMVLCKLRQGRISKSRPPSTFTVTFEMPGCRQRCIRLQRSSILGQVVLLADLTVLNVLSDESIQVSTIGRYSDQVWPESGSVLLAGFQKLLDGQKSTLIDIGNQDRILLSVITEDFSVIAHGSAYFIAQCAEQFAWLEAAFRQDLAAQTGWKPRITQTGNHEYKINSVKVSPIDSPPAIRLLKQIENFWPGLSSSSVVLGYPIAVRPEGITGVEIPLNFLSIYPKVIFDKSSGRLVFREGSSSLCLVKKKMDVWVWHFIPPNHQLCLCQSKHLPKETIKELQELDAQQVATGRHIIAFCDTRNTTGAPPNHSIETSRKPVCDGKGIQLVADQILSYQPSVNQSPCWREHRDHVSDSFDSDMLSISSFSEEETMNMTDLNSDLENIVNHVASALLIQCNIRGYLTGNLEASDGGTPSSNQGGSGPPTSSSRPNSTDLPGANSRKRRYQTDEGKDDGNDDDEAPESHPSKKQVRETVPNLNLFACPFWKLDPIKHRACFRLRLNTSSRVKQHLGRTHTPRFYCQLCYLIFKNRETHESHVTQRCCTRAPGAKLDGIHPEQQQQLSRKPKTLLSEEAKWYRIWDIVLPEHRQPQSPYIDSRLADCCALFREHWQNHGMEVLVREIQASGIFPTYGTNAEATQQVLQQTLARGLVMIWEMWNPPADSYQGDSRPDHCPESTIPSGQYARATVGATPASSFVDSAVGLRGSLPSNPSESHTYQQMPQSTSHPDTFDVPYTGPENEFSGPYSPSTAFQNDCPSNFLPPTHVYSNTTSQPDVYTHLNEATQNAPLFAIWEELDLTQPDDLFPIG